jgi:hypothetical protein
MYFHGWILGNRKKYLSLVAMDQDRMTFLIK